MKTTYRTALCALVLLGISTATLAERPGKEDSADRTTYRRLIRQIRKDTATLARVRSKAIEEAKGNDGSALPTTKAEVLSVRDRIDRKNTHLILLALRHGWEIPIFEEPTSSSDTTSVDTTGVAGELKAEIFGSVDQMVRKALAAEAKEIAEKIALPVISIGGKA